MSKHQSLEQPSLNLRMVILPFSARASTSYSSTYHSSDTTAWICLEETQQVK